MAPESSGREFGTYELSSVFFVSLVYPVVATARHIGATVVWEGSPFHNNRCN